MTIARMRTPADYEALISEMESTGIVGTFYHDGSLWNRASDLVMNEAAPMAVRIRAVELIDRITGEPSGKGPDGEVTEVDVQEFVEEVRDLLGIR